MNVVLIFQVILAALQFPVQIMSFIKLLKDTPEEKHDQLLSAMQKEADKINDTGRPIW